MTPDEAVTACEFWTTNVTETVAIGSTMSEEVAGALRSSVSLPRCQYTDPGGKRCWKIDIGRWQSVENPEGEGLPRLVVENPLYTRIAEEIERRKAAAA